MQTFAIKHRAQLTWEDLPFVEAPVFAHTHIMQMLNNPNHLWMRIENLPEFIRTEIGSYSSLRNHDYANNQIERLIGSGLYFNVCRTGKPFCAAFTWQEDPEHPHKGFWTDPLNYYWRASVAIKNQLMLIANQWHRLQAQSNSDESSLDEWISKTGTVAYAADPFTAKGMNSGYALSPREQLKYISPATEKSEIEPVDYLGIVDDTLKELRSNNVENITSESFVYSDDGIKYGASDFTNKNINKYDELIFKAASENNIPAPILKGLLMLESSLQARGPDSPVGAAGIAQFMPNTAAKYGLSAEDRYLPEKAIPAAAKELKSLHDKFSVFASSPEDGWRITMVAYNQGPGNLNRQSSDGAGAAQRLHGAAERLNLGMDKAQWIGKIPYSALTPASATKHHVEMTVGSTGSIGGYASQFQNDFESFKKKP